MCATCLLKILLERFDFYEDKEFTGKVTAFIGNGQCCERRQTNKNNHRKTNV